MADDAEEPSSAPFLSETPDSPRAPVRDNDLTSSQAWSLYLSHFLSMWNSRAYEYGAILFIQAAFPGNLLPSSINGIAETICVLVFASALGRWVDRAQSRLRPLLLTIIANRVTLVACCLLWLVVFAVDQQGLRRFLFALLLLLGMVEKVSRMTNILSMERDWVPALANSRRHNQRDQQAVVHYDLTHLNTVMRRIDIACKILAPLAVSAFVLAVGASMVAASLGVVSAASMLVEIWSAMTVWRQNDRLRAGKVPAVSTPRGRTFSTPLFLDRIAGLVQATQKSWEAHVGGLRYYFNSSVWLPSICVAILHGSVLAWSGTLITWLLNAGFPLSQVTIAKGAGSVFEFGSTFVFPLGVNYYWRREGSDVAAASYQMVQRRSTDDDDDDNNMNNNEDDDDHKEEITAFDPQEDLLGSSGLHKAVIKVAQLAIGGLLVTLIPTIITLFAVDASIESDGPSRPNTTSAVAIVFFAFLSVSFLGRWTYDLSVTQLTQMLIPAAHRSSFGGTEQAIVSCVSMVHWVGAAIWHGQEAFKWLALASFCGVGAATGAYTLWAQRWKTRAL